MPDRYARYSRHGRPSGSSPPASKFSAEAWAEYSQTPSRRSDEDEALLQALRRRPEEWSQADAELHDEITARDEEREELRRAPLRRELEGCFAHLHLPPLPPPLPRSSLWLGIQRPCNYPDAEVRPFLVACEEGALGEVGRFVREEKAMLRQVGLQDGLACAAQGTQVRVARYLLEEGGAFLHGAVVEAACRARCLPLFELCVRHGYHPDQQMRGGLGVALNHCLGRGQEDIARFLLQNGASPDLARFHDNRMACWGGRRSAPPLDRTAGLALDLAAEKGSLSTVRMLLEHGANANYARPLERAVRRRAAQPDEDDWRPLMEMLMRHGADVNAVTYRGGTALTAAVSRGMADVVDFLLEHGADPRVRKPVTQRDAFAIAAAGAGVAWEETEEAAEYLARLCDAETILHRGDAALVPDEVRRNPLVLSLERIKMRRQGEAGE